MYAVLVEAQEAAVRAATVGTPCEEVDAAARRVIAKAGHGEHFVHRVGHGIGTEAHEDPYMVAGNRAPLVAGNVFSVEPGHLPAGPVRDAPRGHRRRHRRRAACGATRRHATSRSSGRGRVELDAGTFLVQLAAGGMLSAG
ncbi:MAG: hypothetical protein KatS3mg009_3317 [Acidimicrobiia bacterium]|nr:MAG: hypothetical protein KatS3mg009_3317 [Acidimicrobiia bacterium]